MAKIHKTSNAVKEAIKRKSAYSLPDNPSEAGFKATDIRNAFFKPIIDVTNSALSELDRVVNELNGAIGITTKDVDVISRVEGDGYYQGSDGLVYTLKENAFEVCGYEGQENDVTIPLLVIYGNGKYPVVSIAESAFEINKITSVEIAATVKSIGRRAFYNSELTKVKFLGESEIGENTFLGQLDFIVPKEYLSQYEKKLASYIRTLEGFDTVRNNYNEITALRNKLSNIPEDGKVPLYLSGGRIKVAAVNDDNDATPKKYVEDRLKQMGAKLACKFDRSKYKMALWLENEAGEPITSDKVEIDFPLENMIINATYADKVLTLKLNTDDKNNTIEVNISDIISGLVPDERTINGKNLKADITLKASDVGAYAKGETFDKSEVTSLLETQKQKLLVGIEEHQVVGYAYSSTEAEKASGYIKGGGIDKALKALDKRLSILEDK